MKALRLAILTLARDWKSGELGVLLLALLVAVSALTAVGFFTSRVSRAVEQQAGEVLAADLKLQSQNPIDREHFTRATAMGLATAELASFPSVVHWGEQSSLTSIRAVSEGYPLRGRVRVADAPFAKGREVTTLTGYGSAAPSSRLQVCWNIALIKAHNSRALRRPC
jgi:putative ABC transport system permease protein